jgi:cyclase
VDVFRTGQRWEVRICGGQCVIGHDPLDYASRMAEFGAGEILLNDIGRDGMRQGYDLDLIAHVSSSVNVPLIALGGAGEREHLRSGLAAGASAVASGSAFVFHGPLRAVLITYPTPQEMTSEILLPEAQP